MTYYDERHVSELKEFGEHAPELMRRFFSYYGAATASDGALSARERALLGLAVSHAIKCPYCVDVYTEACLSAEVKPDAMTEAVHVAAAISAGSVLIHGMQMRDRIESAHTAPDGDGN